jgi:transposase
MPQDYRGIEATTTVTQEGAIQDIAKTMKFDGQTVNRLEMHYMRAQLDRATERAPQELGINDISIRKGGVYRIVVSDLHRQRRIWFSGDDRSARSMDEFDRLLAKSKARRVRLAVMDMWKPFRSSTTRRAPYAALLFDKSHVLRHLGEALDKLRRHEYARPSGKGLAFIKGKKYALFAHPHNLEGSARKNLKRLV